MRRDACGMAFLAPAEPGAGARTLQKSRINFGESVIETVFSRPEAGPAPPGPLLSRCSRHAPHEHPVTRCFASPRSPPCSRLPARALADAAPDPDEAVDQITQMNREAVTAYQAKKYEDARKVLKQALDLAASAGLDKHPSRRARTSTSAS